MRAHRAGEGRTRREEGGRGGEGDEVGGEQSGEEGEERN